jgi:hypothetical protein
MNKQEFLSMIAPAAATFFLMASMAASAQDACVQLPPPTGHVRECQILPRPADLETLDNTFIDSLGDNSAYPYAQMTTPPVCYGDGDIIYWKEKAFEMPNDVTLERRFIFQRPKYSRGVKLPLIIWAHPNGGSDEIGSIVNLRLAEPALSHDFAFMSLEFRHPTSSRPYEAPKPPPLNQNQNGSSPSAFCAYDSTDVANAIQFASLHSTQLQIDRDNIFLVGQSRGSLSLLTALMKDQIDTGKDKAVDYRAWSSKPSAVFLAQPQVTYDHNQLKSLFIRPLATQNETNVIMAKQLQFPLCRPNVNAVFSYHCQYDKADIVINPRQSNRLSALDELDNYDPPIWVRYERLPPSQATVVPVAMYVADAGVDQTKALEKDCFDQSGLGCLDVHHPNFGVQLRKNYLGLTPVADRKTYVNVQYAPTSTQSDKDRAGRNFFNDYWCFFIDYKALNSPVKANISSTGDANRQKAVNLYTQNRKSIDPPATDPGRCTLSEAIPWDWQRNP